MSASPFSVVTPVASAVMPRRSPAPSGATRLLDSRSSAPNGQPDSSRHSVGPGTQEWLITPRQCPPLGQYGVFLAGWSEARIGFHFSRPRFAMSQLLFCTGGTGEVLVGGRWQTCATGQAYLTPPSVTHAYRAAPDPQGKAWSICWITYHVPIVGVASPHLMRADSQLMWLLLQQLRGEAMGVRDSATMAHWAALLQTHVERHIETARMETGSRNRDAGQECGTSGEKLAVLWEQVARQPEKAWDVAGLAHALGVSGEHLRRLCQRESGCSPMQQVSRIRIAHAATLLTQGLTLAEVADQVGYSSPFVLSNAFQRLMGVRPSQYAASAEKRGEVGAVEGRETARI